MMESKEELIKEIEQQQMAAPSLENIEMLGKNLLQAQLNIIDVLKESVTYSGFVKALKLALVHEVAPEFQKMELVNKQQFLAAHIAKAIDIVANLKMAQIGLKEKEESTSSESEKVEDVSTTTKE